jgi:hypothetical protein
MGEDVARPQHVQDLLVGGRRVVDMGHHGHADLLGDLDGDIERHGSRRAGGVKPDPDLDPDDEVAICIRDLRAVDRVHERELAAFADHHPLVEAVDAGMRDVQVGEDAHLGGLDDVLAKAHPVAGAGRAGIDGRRDAAPPAELLRIDAERGAAPINVGVQVDEPRRHDEPGHVADVRAARSVETRPDPGDIAGLERDVGDGVELLRRVQHPAALQNEIVWQTHPPLLAVPILHGATVASRSAFTTCSFLGCTSREC